MRLFWSFFVLQPLLSIAQRARPQRCPFRWESGMIKLRAAVPKLRQVWQDFRTARRVRYLTDDGSLSTGRETAREVLKVRRTHARNGGRVYGAVSLLLASLLLTFGMFASVIDRGVLAVVNVNDVGFNGVLILGQSNAAGRGIVFDARFDITDPRIFVYGNPVQTGNAYSGVISQATEPLLHRDGAQGVGPGFPFARWLATTLVANRRILLIPCASGGTPLYATNQLTWNSTVTGTNSLYQSALSTAQAAATQAGANYRHTATLWIQGETDGDAGVTQAQYAGALDALITKWRTDLGVANLPFIVGPMVTEYLASGTRAQINAAHVDTPRRVLNTAFAYGPVGSIYNNGDGNHWNAIGQRGPVTKPQLSVGHSMFNALSRARANVLGIPAVVPTGVAVVQTSATATSVVWQPVIGRATDYNVRYRQNGGAWTTLTRAQSIDVAAAITGLTGAALVEVQVASVNEQGTSAWSTSATLTLVTAPNPVTALTAGTATATQYPLSWTEPAVDAGHSAATSKTVEYKKSSDSTWTLFSNAVTGLTTTVTGLVPSTAYDFRVTAVNVAGSSTTVTITNLSTAASTSPLTTAGVTAYRAYGLRKQRDAYNGNAALVRRSSDNTTQAIGFTGSGAFDVTALMAFVGSGNSAWIATLYDQSGSGFDLTQSTTSAQYRIVNAGTVDMMNGVPAPFTAGAAYWPDSTNFGLYTQSGITICQTFQYAQPSVTTAVLVGETSSTSTSPRYIIYGSSANTFVSVQVRNDAATNLATLTGTVAAFNNIANQHSYVDNSTNVAQWVNGATSGSAAYSTARTGTLTANRFSVGTFFNGSTTAAGFLTGYMGELIIAGSALSTGTRQAIESNQKSFYGTP